MTTSEFVRYSVAGGVATIELARADKKNALTIEMYHAIAAGLRSAGDDPEVRAIVVQGQPGIFCAGNDLTDFLERPLAGRSGTLSPFMLAFFECEKSIVAAVTGPAVGVGVTMLLHCDLVYLADRARLSIPFVALGLVPEFGSSLLLPRLLGPARVAEKLYLGEPIEPAEAVACGIATAVVPADEVVARAQAAAQRITRLPPAAVRATKHLLRAPDRERLVAVATTETQALAERLGSAEAREALAAFLEKRPPKFYA